MGRYALFALPAGVSFTGFLLWLAGRKMRLAGQAAAVVALAGVVLYLPPKVPVVEIPNFVAASVARLAGQLDESVPLVLVNPIDVTAVDEQPDNRLRERTVFVADPALALAYTGTNGIDLGYLLGEPYLGLRVRRLSYAQLTTGRNRLYLVGKWQALSWLPQRLRDDGWTLTSIGGTRQAPVFDARHLPTP